MSPGMSVPNHALILMLAVNLFYQKGPLIRSMKKHHGEKGRSTYWGLGAVSIRKTVLPGMAIPMLKIRRPNGRLIFNMEITIRR